LTFKVGDKVIYPNHGLGIVELIEDRTILGTTCGFYKLRMVSNDTTVLVPVGNVESVGLRRAIDDAEVERLFSLLSDGKIDKHQNWKGRFKDNSDKMRTGSIYDVVDVLKNLTLLSKSKNLSFREKRMLDRAKFLVVSEISEVVSQSAETIEERVSSSLERCFVMRNRALARAKAKKASKASGAKGSRKSQAVKAKASSKKSVARKSTARKSTARKSTTRKSKVQKVVAAKTSSASPVASRRRAKAS
jgi:CarD family transcriptional regulator